MMIRATSPQDRRRLLSIHRAAFEQEDLRPLVTALLDVEGIVSLAAGPPGAPIGHVLFTPARIVEEGAGAPGWPGGRAAEGAPAMLLGPLAVAPGEQGAGIGQALVRGGLQRLTAQGKPSVLVLGDPAYYGRFGFRAEPGVCPPYPLPEGWAPAWQSLSLDGNPVPSGTLRLPDPWLDPSYWNE